KPAQKPHPPILLGTLSAQGLNRVTRYCDGWIPVGLMLKDLPAAIRDLRAHAEQAGRKPSAAAVSSFRPAAKEAALQEYQQLGVERTVFGLPPAERDKVLPLLDQYAAMIPKFA